MGSEAPVTWTGRGVKGHPGLGRQRRWRFLRSHNPPASLLFISCGSKDVSSSSVGGLGVGGSARPDLGSAVHEHRMGVYGHRQAGSVRLPASHPFTHHSSAHPPTHSLTLPSPTHPRTPLSICPPTGPSRKCFLSKHLLQPRHRDGWGDACVSWLHLPGLWPHVGRCLLIESPYK